MQSAASLVSPTALASSTSTVLPAAAAAASPATAVSSAQSATPAPVVNASPVPSAAVAVSPAATPSPSPSQQHALNEGVALCTLDIPGLIPVSFVKVTPVEPVSSTDTEAKVPAVDRRLAHLCVGFASGECQVYLITLHRLPAAAAAPAAAVSESKTSLYPR